MMFHIEIVNSDEVLTLIVLASNKSEAIKFASSKMESTYSKVSVKKLIDTNGIILEQIRPTCYIRGSYIKGVCNERIR